MKRKPLILITNDDGIDAAGIRHLRRALDRLGETVVFAPKSEKSGASHSFSLRKPLEVVWRDTRTVSVDGTPTDCVMLAVRGLMPRRPDLVVSGINHGPNLGDDVTYSGTVAGAIEGTLLGIPSLAVSSVDWTKPKFTAAAAVAARVAAMVLRRGLPRNTLLNVNVPSVAPGAIKGYRVTRLGKRIYRDVIVEKRAPDGRKYFMIDGADPDWEREAGTDFAAIERGLVSITPFHLDWTNHRAIEGLKRWERCLS
ncbi:MAG: 5'/3'-nucleotidase SurE [Candidatus Edwardsbacteria bacterium]|jgi:5'-nucleotidase|nr:5'/3'-nucleotidase SurE [Candidatus Edwardsbacteria bacterium]